jgi:uncharacterized protein
VREAILVDTSALVGYFRREDQHHESAKKTLALLQAERRKMVATTDIFNEVVTAVRRWMGYDKAVYVGETLRGTQLLRQVPVDEPLRQMAWRRFKELRLPMLSFTDCTSFEVMDKFGIKEAFTFDADFAKAGYGVIPETK